MNNLKTKLMLGAMLGIAGAGTANAAVVNIGNPANNVQLVPADGFTADVITGPATWTADNTYNLLDQIYIQDGATLTIEAGVVIASNPTANGKAGLAVTRGGKLIAIGTQDEPIIFTSTADVATWDPLPSHPTGKDPKTGVWRAAAREWGNVTFMGKAYISEDIPALQNESFPDPGNYATMEGLIGEIVDDPNTLYGGGDDDDNSGTLSYVSFRYGGRVADLTVELNGLSLGGIGRETQIDHIDIMNNVDDGIEIWGGTVNLKYVNIWNIGDDSFDVDQGWRGKAQFGLIVQGYSLNPSAQGGGVGDNVFEMDGAEESDFQPVTTATLYNFTAIGQPAGNGGDHGTAWRDNARIQYRNCIIMDLGERLVSFDNVDGDGGQGYGFGAPATLTWPATWTTNYNAVPAHPNDPASPSTFYTAQSAGDASIGQGKLAEITDSVFFRNLHAQAYTESDARGVTLGGGSNPAKGNVVIPGFNPPDAPIASITRGGPVNIGALTMLPVTSLDPRAANEAISSEAMAPDDGFFTPVGYRGAFGPDENWLCNWTAADAFGFNVAPPGGCVVVNPCPPDLNGDSTVNVADLLMLIGSWGACGVCPADLNGDGSVNVVDLLQLIGSWGVCP